MTCGKCKEEKPTSAFSPSRIRKSPNAAWCRACSKAYGVANKHKWREKTNATKRKWYAVNSDKNRDYMFRKNYGISLDDYQAVLHAQGGLCVICRQPWPGKRPLVVDHDHETGMVRGLLCQGCNVGLGALREDVGILESAIRYLTR